MKDELFDFQVKAVAELRSEAKAAMLDYSATHKGQIISFSSPTGSGKTNMMISFVERTFFGEIGYPADPDAVFLWLSDSPELNAQSRLKFEEKSDRIPISQYVTIDSDFDAEKFEGQHVYFLNTQKIGRDKLLTRLSDARQYSIWQTIQNTVAEYPEHVYLIIDEAHRGAKTAKDVGEANSIMQKFILGSPKDGLSAMPVVIGMTATPQRFLELVKIATNATLRKVTVDPEDVRASGLLKDRIIVRYPDLAYTPDMAMLEAAADDWKRKCDAWAYYAKYSADPLVEPILIIQVQNSGKAGKDATATDLSECLRVIQERTKQIFKEGEVVHTFNGQSSILANSLNIQYVEPSRIDENKQIKIVFFKENLSTGWDCPRAETMMSFRTASDATNIAQILGRMIRTPLAKRIASDEELNEVELFLPHFDQKTVNDVVEALKENEGPELPTQIITKQKHKILSIDTPIYVKQSFNDVLNSSGASYVEENKTTYDAKADEKNLRFSDKSTVENEAVNQSQKINVPANETENHASMDFKDDNGIFSSSSSHVTQTLKMEPYKPSFNRREVVDAINNASIATYRIYRATSRKPSQSLFKLADFLVNHDIDIEAKDDVVDELVEEMHQTIERLKQNGRYEELAEKVTSFQMKGVVYDSFGKAMVGQALSHQMIVTNYDVDRQYNVAVGASSRREVSQEYLRRYADPDDYDASKVEIIVYFNDPSNVNRYESICKKRFDDLCDSSRGAVTKQPAEVKSRYNDIVALSGSAKSEIYELPMKIDFPNFPNGTPYASHLFPDEDGTPLRISFDSSWEPKLVSEEEQRPDFVCWLRLVERASWAIVIPYTINGEYRAFYPDMLIIRKDKEGDYIFDILEPHDPSRIDNLPKAKAFARYAEDNPNARIGRLELIRMEKGLDGKEHFCRLDLMKHACRQEVLKASTNDELSNIIQKFGISDGE